VHGLGDNFGALRALSVSVAILDRSGLIVAVNEAWRDFGRRSGLRLPHFGVGVNYLRYCRTGSSDSLELINDLKDLLAGKSIFLARIYPCHSRTERRWFYMIGLPLSGSRRSGVALLHVDITPFFPFPVAAGGESSGASKNVKKVDVDAVARSVESSSLEALSQQVARLLAAGQGLSSPQTDRYARQKLALAGLSKRQLEIFGLLAEGKTNAEIANLLSRSPNTVKLHVSAILRQLNVNTRTQAALLASKLLTQEFEETDCCLRESVTSA
jgi:DNA-binding CsgD family transcriptional regulator